MDDAVMANRPAVELATLVTDLASCAIETQRRLDAQHEKDLKSALPAARLLAEFGPGSVSSVLPARPFVSRMEFDARITMSRSRAFGFALMAKPVNLGVRISHESTEATEARIQIEIEQILYPAAANKPAT